VLLSSQRKSLPPEQRTQQVEPALFQEARCAAGGEDTMAPIDKKLVTERETATYKLDRATVELIRCYAEFIGSPQEHVVNESLLFIFRKDREFNDWLKSNGKLPVVSASESGPDRSPKSSKPTIQVGNKA
jgi:hypothetical protein